MKKTMWYLLRFAAGVFGLFVLMTINGWWMALCGVAVHDIEHPVTDLSKIIVSVLLQTTLGIVSLYQIFLLGLYALTLGKKPTPAIIAFLDASVIRRLRDIYRRRLSSGQRTVFSLSVWGAFIFAIVSLVASTDYFAHDEVFFHKTEFTRSFLLPNRTEMEAIAQGADGDPVRCLQFMTEDNNVGTYFRDLYTIARDLKDAGAKVVVADMTEGSWPGGGPGIPRMPDEMVKKIQALNIVVWGLRSTPWLTGQRYPRHEQIRMKGNTAVTIHPVNSVLAMPMPVPLSPTIAAWYPLMKPRITNDREYNLDVEYNVDVAIMAAMKYYDIPDTSVLSSDGNTVSVGGLSIRVSSDGAAYTNIYVLPYIFGPVIATRGWGGYEGHEWSPDSLHYRRTGAYQPIGATALSDTCAIKDLKAYSQYFSGKVVVINWTNDNQASFQFGRLPIATVISSVLRNTLYKRIDVLTYLFMVAAISILALISVFFTKRWILVAAFALIIGVTVFAWWMVFSYRVIFDPLYPIAAIVVACVIYSLLRYTREAA